MPGESAAVRERPADAVGGTESSSPSVAEQTGTAGSTSGAAIEPPGRQFSPTSGLIAVGALIAAVMVLGLVVMAMRRRLLRDQGAESAAGLLDDLRDALREGKMTQEEFDAAKRAMIARLAGPRTPEKGADHGP